MTQIKLTETEFNNLFNLYYEELCRIVFPVIKDTDVAQDVVQDVFVKMWTRRNELSIAVTYKAYLYKAVIFRALDYLRKQKHETQAKENLKVVHNQFYNNTDALIEEKELNQAINEGLDKMPENMRMIFNLSRFSSLKNREIAEQLNISIKTVESNMSKALKLMHQHLKLFVKSVGCLLLWTLWFIY
jgi:RNA polymerase sigma-70 factor, ECF subfamily